MPQQKLIANIYITGTYNAEINPQYETNLYSKCVQQDEEYITYTDTIQKCLPQAVRRYVRRN